MTDSNKIGAIACKFRGSGQTCVCANRIYVQSPVYAEFASRLAEKVAAFKVGDGLEDGTYVSQYYVFNAFLTHADVLQDARTFDPREGNG